jgi:hypothetical protein
MKVLDMMGFFISCEDPHECHAATHIGIHTSIHAIQITVLTCTVEFVYNEQAYSEIRLIAK